MALIESITTAGLAPHKRRHFWEEAVSRTFTPLSCKPAFPNEFGARLQRIQLGSLSLSRAVSSPASVIHGAARARLTCEQVFLLHLQAQGSSVNHQDGREAALTKGDFTLCDSARPYSVSFDANNDMLVLRIPAHQLRERMVGPENFTAQRICGSKAIGGVVSLLLRQFWAEYEHGVEPGIVERIGGNVLDLVVTALCAQQTQCAQETSRTNAQRLRIRYFVEDHLFDIDLDAGKIAAALQISPRYVHKLLGAEEESLGQYVVRRRLEESARRLKDPAHAARSVMEIGFDCGFTDASYFGRRFRRRFDMTPREYRCGT
ncbi:MAG: AraC family transcriptional regulator [Pseudomonadota bacterium]